MWNISKTTDKAHHGFKSNEANISSETWNLHPSSFVRAGDRLCYINPYETQAELIAKKTTRASS